MPVIRPEVPTDAEAIREIHRRAFGRDAEAALVDAVRASPGYLPDLSLVAEAAGVLVGHLLLSAIAIRTERGDVPALALAPVAVLPERQGQGVGTALIEHGLERARAAGHRLVVVVGHPTYYPRFGFAPARPRGLEAPFPVSDAAFMALALAPGALDGLRGTVVYPPAFADV